MLCRSFLILFWTCYSVITTDIRFTLAPVHFHADFFTHCIFSPPFRFILSGSAVLVSFNSSLFFCSRLSSCHFCRCCSRCYCRCCSCCRIKCVRPSTDYICNITGICTSIMQISNLFRLHAVSCSGITGIMY